VLNARAAQALTRDPAEGRGAAEDVLVVAPVPQAVRAGHRVGRHPPRQRRRRLRRQRVRALPVERRADVVVSVRLSGSTELADKG